MNAPLMFGLCSQALMVGTVAVWLVRRWSQKRWGRGVNAQSTQPLPWIARPWAPWGLALGIGALSLIPLGGTSLCQYLRGFWNDVSPTTLQLCLLSLAGWQWPPRQRLGLLVSTLLGAALLYPTALSNLPLDAYRWGFAAQAPIFLGALVLLGLLALRSAPVLAVILGLDLFAFGAGLLDGDNLWDYLLDPILVTYALFTLGPALAALRRPAAPAPLPHESPHAP